MLVLTIIKCVPSNSISTILNPSTYKLSINLESLICNFTILTLRLELQFLMKEIGMSISRLSSGCFSLMFYHVLTYALQDLCLTDLWGYFQRLFNLISIVFWLYLIVFFNILHFHCFRYIIHIFNGSNHIFNDLSTYLIAGTLLINTNAMVDTTYQNF